MKNLFKTWLALLLPLVMLVTLSGCGGSGGGSSTSSPVTESGDLVIGLTDAEGEFLSYRVDVTSIRLFRADGAVVETLPLTTTLDFAQYVEVTELLTAATVPSGVYTSAEMTLDYSSVDIVVQNDAGEPVSATALDRDGNPLTTLTLSVELDGRDSFRILPGVPAQLTLDFDLDASHEIDIVGDTATVTVDPILLADTVLEEPKSLRLRGLTGQVDTAGDLFVVDIRPFHLRQGAFGSVRAHVDDETLYEIDGIPYNGADGLQALAALPVGSAVITLGLYDRSAGEFQVDEVYAGSSVPWGESDLLRGTVIARSGDLLTVRGGVVELANGQFVFNDDISVQLSAMTTVTRQGDGDNAYSIADISVGSAIQAIGNFSGDTLDASAGHVRLHYASVAGTVTGVSPLVVDTFAINARRVALYDFAGTGIDAANDAHPEHYEINTGSLGLGSLALNDPVRIRGFVTPFGSAPEDFNARTVIDVSELHGRLVVTYPDGSTTAIASLSGTGLLLDLTEAGSRHHIVQAGIPTDLTTLPAMPWIIPDGERGVFALSTGGAIRVYSYYADFVTALQAELDAGALVQRVDAGGTFDGDTFTTRRLRVRLQP